MSLKTFTLSSLTALVLSGCQLAPAQTATDLPVPDRYAISAPATGVAAAELHWQQFFSHHKLQQLIQLSLAESKDLQLAALKVQQVRALYQIQDSNVYPNLDLNAAASRQRLPADLSGTDQARISQQNTATVGLTSYELDLWGKVRNQSAQALQQLYATEQAQLSSQISLVAEIANAWLTYAAHQQLLELATHTLNSQQKSLELTTQSYQLGAASALTLQQVKSTVAAAKVEVASYQRLLNRDKNALDVLSGTAVPAELLPDQPLSRLLQLPELPAGLPADLLQQRPDLKAAEHELLAANANIGVAKAAFFPSISLTANAGSASAELTDLFSAGSGSWSFVPQLHLPIFNWGRTQANLELATTQQQLALTTYQQKIQQAFREVSDALVDHQAYSGQLAARRELADSNQQSFVLAQARYKQGVDSYLQVLDAQRNWYSAQQQLIVGQQSLLASQISLYKVLGGGWQSQPAHAE